MIGVVKPAWRRAGAIVTLGPLEGITILLWSA